MGAAKEITNANRQALGARERGHAGPISSTFESHQGIRQTNSLQTMNDMGRLCFLASKKLPTCGDIVEQVPNLNLRSRGNPDLTNSFDLPAANDHFRSRFGQCFARRQTEPRYARDARECFAAKAHRPYQGEVGRLANLARRVAFETEKRVLAIHATAIIAHRHGARPSAGKIDPNPLRSGVETVLDQLLNQGSRSLDNLPCRDLAGHVIGQKTNFSHN